MRILSLGLSLVIVASAFVSTGGTEAPPAPRVAAVAVHPHPAVVAPSDASANASRTDGAAPPSPRLARSLDDRERDSLLGVLLLIALKRSAQAH